MKRGVNRFIFVGIVSEDPCKLEEGKLQRYKLELKVPEHLGDEDFFEYFQVIVWGSLGDFVYKEVSVGCKIYVEGRIRTRFVGEFRNQVQEFHVSKLNILED